MAIRDFLAATGYACDFSYGDDKPPSKSIMSLLCDMEATGIGLGNARRMICRDIEMTIAADTCRRRYISAAACSLYF